jgi:hypothetical protein
VFFRFTVVRQRRFAVQPTRPKGATRSVFCFTVVRQMYFAVHPTRPKGTIHYVFVSWL